MLEVSLRSISQLLLTMNDHAKYGSGPACSFHCHVDFKGY